MKLYQRLAQLIQARTNCMNGQGEHRNDWLLNHTNNIADLVEKHMPSGSGFDNGTTLDLDRSTSEKLVFNTSYHHMDENGYYDGWTDYRITVKASLAFDFDMKIAGRDRNQIKDYMYDVFRDCLNVEVK